MKLGLLAVHQSTLPLAGVSHLPQPLLKLLHFDGSCLQGFGRDFALSSADAVPKFRPGSISVLVEMTTSGGLC